MGYAPLHPRRLRRALPIFSGRSVPSRVTQDPLLELARAFATPALARPHARGLDPVSSSQDPLHDLAGARVAKRARAHCHLCADPTGSAGVLGTSATTRTPTKNHS